MRQRLAAYLRSLACRLDPPQEPGLLAERFNGSPIAPISYSDSDGTMPSFTATAQDDNYFYFFY